MNRRKTRHIAKSVQGLFERENGRAYSRVTVEKLVEAEVLAGMIEGKSVVGASVLVFEKNRYKTIEDSMSNTIKRIARVVQDIAERENGYSISYMFARQLVEKEWENQTLRGMSREQAGAFVFEKHKHTMKPPKP